MMSTVKRKAALAVALFFAASALAAAGEPVPGDSLAALFSGMTLDGIYADGSYFTETYNEDGTVRYHDIEQSDWGQWSVKDGMFCTFYESLNGACFRVERDGANCFSFYEATDPADHTGQSSQWTSRGWDRSQPSTCPQAPEVAI